MHTQLFMALIGVGFSVYKFQRMEQCLEVQCYKHVEIGQKIILDIEFCVTYIHSCMQIFEWCQFMKTSGKVTIKMDCENPADEMCTVTDGDLPDDVQTSPGSVRK